MIAEKRTPWSEPLRNRRIWSRALRIGVPVGLLQVAINQGDHWLLGTVTAGVVLKTVASPVISTALAFAGAASMWRRTS